MKSIFAKRLKDLRESSGMSQSDLARALHVDRTTVAGYEICRRFPDAETMCAIADLFNVSVDYLLGRDRNDT